MDEQRNAVRINGSGSVIKTLLIFGFLFNLYTPSLPSWMGSKIISTVILSIIGLIRLRCISFRKLETATIIRRIAFYNVFLLFYSYYIIRVEGTSDDGMLFIPYIFRLFVFGIGAAYIFKWAFTDLDDFMVTLRNATLLQILIIVLFLLLPSFQVVVDSFFGNLEKNVSLRATGYITGINCVGAPGMLKLLPGFMASIYLIKKERTSNKRIANIVILLIHMLVASVLARTGFVFSVIALIILYKESIKSLKIDGRTLLVGILILILILIIFVLGISLNWIPVPERLLRFFREGTKDAFFYLYFHGYNTYIPPITKETVRGIGIISGYSGSGIRVNVDGGYLRLYTAVGVPVAIITYLYLYKSLYRLIKLVKVDYIKSALQFMFVGIILGEYKEFFIYTGYGIGVFFAIVFLYEAERQASLVRV